MRNQKWYEETRARLVELSETLQRSDLTETERGDAYFEQVQLCLQMDDYFDSLELSKD